MRITDRVYRLLRDNGRLTIRELSAQAGYNKHVISSAIEYLIRQQRVEPAGDGYRVVMQLTRAAKILTHVQLHPDGQTTEQIAEAMGEKNPSLISSQLSILKSNDKLTNRKKEGSNAVEWFPVMEREEEQKNMGMTPNTDPDWIVTRWEYQR